MTTIQSDLLVGDKESTTNSIWLTELRSRLSTIEWPQNKPAKIVVLGLNGSGKSTLIDFLLNGSITVGKRRPTLTFSFNRCNYGDLKAIFVDVPGQLNFWSKWASYMKGADGVIFVIDSTKGSDIAQAADIYKRTMQGVEKIPAAFLANKQDLGNSLTGNEIRRMMAIEPGDRETRFFETIAISGNGITQSLVWLLQTAKQSLNYM